MDIILTFLTQSCRWIMIRIDILSALFTVGLATYLVYGMKGHAQASDAGFSINSAIAFSSSIIWWVRLVNLFEVSGKSQRVDYGGYRSDVMCVFEQATVWNVFVIM